MNNTPKIISIFGSTGSIGCNSLTVIDSLILNGYDIEVKYLTTNSSIDTLVPQIRKYAPKGIVINSKAAYKEFISKYRFKNLEVLSGTAGLIEIASRDDHNFLVNALVGFSGLMPTVAAIKSKKDIAIANKETLVVAGKIITELISENCTRIFPIDSEHSAILQCLIGESIQLVSKLILTGSGGPFLNKTTEEIKNASIESALSHPNWKMGKKITIDSATMMNKGLEVIEAKWLFDINCENIEVVIHPQSIIHSMVEFKDGSVKAQLGLPDMKIPIQYSLTFPDRITSDYPKIDFKKLKTLTFDTPDYDKFRCLKIAYNVLKEEGTYPAVMNAANETAVELFLNKKINFPEIPVIIEKQLNSHNSIKEFTIDNLLEINQQTRDMILNDY